MTLPRFQWSALDATSQSRLLARPAVNASTVIDATVADVIEKVRRDGDAALLALTAQFDGASLTTLAVTEDEFAAAEAALSSDDKQAMVSAIENIRRFHAAQRSAPIRVETRPGVICERIVRPIESVGLYVPAGTASLPSAAMMLCVPATLAGCDTRVLCSPPDENGQIAASILFAARSAGVDQVFKLGGAQAIAAMAYGTESVPKVSKVFGPGNAYVTSAKSQVAADPAGAAQDMPAGPSEVLVIADDAAIAEHVAADLLSQAEHGADSQVVLLTTSATLIDDVERAIAQQLEQLGRKNIMEQALANSALIEVDSLEQAVSVSNHYAPEHLIVNVADPRQLLDSIRNAGSVFLGRLTPESLGDYCSGTNHVLPTYGYARNYSGLGIEQFQLQMTVQEVNREGLKHIGPVAETLARLEGLDAHALAVQLRLQQEGY
ncbi:MAG: histidinol dehydrogenase [Pseudomonadota bacterium]